MANLLGLQKLPKDLGKHIGIDAGDKANDEKLKGAILSIYNSAKKRICQVADNVARGIIQEDEDVKILDEANEPTLPDEEEWDFQLGDTVKIALSRKDFKWTQKKTIGWRPNFNDVYGQIGIVFKLLCKYENSIGVYFPDAYTACSLYAGTLEKAKPRHEPELLSRWKIGNFVTPMPSAKVLSILLLGLDQIPDELMRSRGRVVGVTHPCIVVTFDEKKTFFLKSSSLVPCKDETPLSPPKIKHARGFQVGDQVQIASNLKNLIKNQKDKGGWSLDMSLIKGKTATVINVENDDTLILQTKNNRGWRISSDSVLSSEEKTEEKDLELMPGDVVRVFVPQNFRVFLAMAEVPLVFLEFLRASAVVSLVDDGFDYRIRFNQDQNILAHSNTLCKATASEKKQHDKIENLVKGLKKGHKVHLDIGPPNFVEAVIAELGLDPKVKTALTKSARLIGFIDPYRAVIEYENGLRCRVKKQYLTVPEKFYMELSKETVEPETVARIRDAIATSVKDIHAREDTSTKEWKVNAIRMFHGNPPCVEFRVESTVATYKIIFAWLDWNTCWKVENLGDGRFMVRGVGKSDIEVKVEIVFNNEKDKFLSELVPSKPEVVFGGHEEGPSAKNKTEPFNTDDPRHPIEETPDFISVQDFQYLRLYDPALARNVYFPYVIHGQRRTPIEPLAQDGGLRNGASVVNNYTHVTNHNY